MLAPKKKELAMSKLVNITKQFVETVQPIEKDQIFWDSSIKGFGMKVPPKGRRA